MKNVIIFSLYLILISCSNSDSNTDPNSVDKTIDNKTASISIDKESIREKVMRYSNQKNDPIIYDYFIAFNLEYGDRAKGLKYGAFDNFNIVTDSLDENSKKIPKQQLQAESSFYIKDSEEFYEKDNNMGRLYLVGLQFDLSSTGDILDYRRYIIFWNDNNKTNNISTIYSSKKGSKMIADYLK